MLVPIVTVVVVMVEKVVVVVTVVEEVVVVAVATLPNVSDPLKPLLELIPDIVVEPSVTATAPTFLMTKVIFPPVPVSVLNVPSSIAMLD